MDREAFGAWGFMGSVAVGHDWSLTELGTEPRSLYPVEMLFQNEDKMNFFRPHKRLVSLLSGRTALWKLLKKIPQVKQNVIDGNLRSPRSYKDDQQ